MEFVEINDGEVGEWVILKFGFLKLQDIEGGVEGCQVYIQKMFDKFYVKMGD